MKKDDSLLQSFQPSEDLIKIFLKEANGKGLNWLSLWLMKAQYDSSSAIDLLAQAVEGGLIASFQSVKKESKVVFLEKDDEIILLQAITRRIPRVESSIRTSLAEKIISQLKDNLSAGQTLLIDGANVIYRDNMLTAEIHEHNK